MIGPITNGAAGSRELTQPGVLGAVVVIAFVAAFMGCRADCKDHA
jgi:hypothetical protein